MELTNKYENVFIINPELSEDDTKALVEKFTGLISSNGTISARCISAGFFITSPKLKILLSSVPVNISRLLLAISRSHSKTFLPFLANAAESPSAVVLFPTPPLADVTRILLYNGICGLPKKTKMKRLSGAGTHSFLLIINYSTAMHILSIAYIIFFIHISANNTK